MIIYVENLKGLTRTPETSLNIIARFQDTRLNIQKLIAALYASPSRCQRERRPRGRRWPWLPLW